MSAKKIIIPKGTVGPNDTLIIDITGTPIQEDKFIVARRLEYPPTPASFQRNYSRVPTRSGSPSRQTRYSRDDSSYFEGSPEWSHRIDFLDSSFEPRGSLETSRSRSPSPANVTRNLRRNETMRNATNDSSLGILTSRQMRTTDGSSLGTSGSGQSYSADVSSVGTSGSYHLSGASSPRSILSGIGSINQHISRSDFSLNPRQASPQRRVQSTSSIYINENLENSSFAPPHASTPINNPNLTYARGASSPINNPNFTYARGASSRINNPNLTYARGAPNATYNRNVSEYLPVHANTPITAQIVREGNDPNMTYVRGPNATYNQSIPQFLPAHASTPASRNANQSSAFIPPQTSTPLRRRLSFTRTQTPNEISAEFEDFIEEEPYEDSSMYDSSEMDDSTAPRSATRTILTRTIETPTDISEETIEETSEEPSEMYDSSDMFDSSDERMNDSMMGRVIAGDMGRRLVFPTPPGQPSGTGRVVYLGGNTSQDQKSVKFKSTNSFFSNHSINQPNATYNNSAYGAGSLGILQPDQMNSTFGPGNRTRTTTDSGSLGLMRSSKMRSDLDSGSLGLMKSSQMRSGLRSPRPIIFDCPCETIFGNGSDSLGLMNSSQMQSGLGSGSLGLMRSGQMESGLGSGSLGLMRSGQMESGLGSGSLGLMRSGQMESGLGSGSLGLMRSGQMESGLGSGSLGLMRSVQMESSFGPNQIADPDLSYEDFNPAANSSAINLRGNQTFNINQPNATYDTSFADLERLEAREQNMVDADLRVWQEARRQFIADMTTLKSSR